MTRSPPIGIAKLSEVFMNSISMISIEGCHGDDHRLEKGFMEESDIKGYSLRGWMMPRVKPGSYFLRMRMRYECLRHKFATNNSQQFNSLARISLRKEGCDVTFTSNSLRICICMKYEPGFSTIGVRYKVQSFYKYQIKNCFRVCP